MLKNVDNPGTFSTKLNALHEMNGLPKLNLTGFVPASVNALQQYFGFGAPAPSAPTTMNLATTGADNSPLTTVSLAATEVHQLSPPMRVPAPSRVASPQYLTNETQQTPAPSVKALLSSPQRATFDPEQASGTRHI